MRRHPRHFVRAGYGALFAAAATIAALDVVSDARHAADLRAAAIAHVDIDAAADQAVAALRRAVGSNDAADLGPGAWAPLAPGGADNAGDALAPPSALFMAPPQGGLELVWSAPGETQSAERWSAELETIAEALRERAPAARDTAAPRLRGALSDAPDALTFWIAHRGALGGQTTFLVTRTEALAPRGAWFVSQGAGAATPLTALAGGGVGVRAGLTNLWASDLVRAAAGPAALLALFAAAGWLSLRTAAPRHASPAARGAFGAANLAHAAGDTGAPSKGGEDLNTLDDTAILVMRRTLRDSEARFQELAESTKVIPWAADLETKRFTYIGPQIAELTGYPAESWGAFGFWAQHIHPEDRLEILNKVSKLVGATGHHTLEYRIRSADGRILYVRNMLQVARTAPDAARPDGGLAAQGYLLDITEIRQASKTVELARARAEEANRVKTDFLANMSHELRTPLNAIIGFSEIMKDEIFGPLDAQYQEYAQNIHVSGEHLLDLINDVLDISKIEAGRIDLAQEPTDVGALVKDCARLLAERRAAAGLVERQEIADDIPPMLIDARRIKQVVINLISNAIKFTPPGGEITIGAHWVAGAGLRLWVRDTGIGMTQAEIPVALTKFGQVDSELARSHQGTGLGLPIAKSLIEMHGGRLEIRSEKGVGTEMGVFLPEARRADLAA